METIQKSNLITIRECMERLSCSRSFIYTLIDKGHLETRKLGTARRILENSLNKVLQEGYENDDSEPTK
jgi:excisionase family DNA binding protein